jgi:hypothetical protein
MRIRITQKPRNASVDGVRLDGFELGREYEVGTSIGSVMLSEGWAEPVVDRGSAPAALADPLALAADFARRFRGRAKP